MHTMKIVAQKSTANKIHNIKKTFEVVDSSEVFFLQLHLLHLKF